MSIPVTTYSASADVVVCASLDVAEVAPGLFAFREKLGRRVLPQVGTFKIGGLGGGYTAEGFIDAKNLKAKRTGKHCKTKDLVLLASEAIEMMRIDGYHRACDAITKSEKTGAPLIRKDAFTALTSGEATIENVVRVDWGNFILFDHEDRPLPVALTFNYMQGHFDESRYDLRKAAQHLLTRPDVVVFRNPPYGASYDERRGRTPVPAASADEAIQPIPYYNATSRRSHQIVFRWMPDAETYRQIASNVKSLALSDDVRRAVFDLDLLGLRAAGAARFADYYQSVETEDEEE